MEELFEYPIRGALHLKQFSELILKAARPELAAPPHEPVMPPEFTDGTPVFEAVREHENILIAPPYHSFAPVVRMLEELMV